MRASRCDWEREFSFEEHIGTAAKAMETFLAAYMDPDRGLIYDSPAGYPPPFPTAEEVRGEIPNSQGWFTPIENCNHRGAMVLWALGRGVNGFDENQRPAIGGRVFRGMRLLWEIPGNGFVARGILPGTRAFYPNNSIDQVPNYLRGIWAWARSDIATPEERNSSDVLQ